MQKSGRILDGRPKKKRPERFKPFYFEGRKYSLTPDRGVYRLRCRKAGDEMNVSTGRMSRAAAEDWAREYLSGRIIVQKPEPAKPSTETLADVVRVYQRIPRKAGARATDVNITRLRSIVNLVHGKPLEEVPIEAANPKLWLEYARLRQGGTLDLSASGRKRVNVAINSAIRCAKSIFTESLWPAYKEHGIVFAPDVGTSHSLPEPALRKAPPKSGLLWAWKRLYKTDYHLWLCIGLARCAGLRKAELEAVARDWVVNRRGTVSIDLTDREGYNNKTGQQYYAPVISKRLAREILKIKDGKLIHPELPQPQKTRIPFRATRNRTVMSRPVWFETVPQKWLRSFVDDQKPLHRMRSLYLQDVETRHEAAFAAKQAGKQAAAKAAGHTTTKVRDRNYNEG
jgi:hypothetical protein